MSLADHKGDDQVLKLCICGEVIWCLLKYYIYCPSVPSLHAESTDSLIGGNTVRHSKALSWKVA